MNTSHKTPEIKVIEPKLPQGGGTIKGMGEEFAPHEFSGAASLSIPIPSTACRGMAPALSLQYSSGNANSAYGFGWDLSLSHISRQTSKGVPKYDAPNTDTFLLSGDDYLVKKLEEDDKQVQIGEITYEVTRYIPRVEGNFSLIDHFENTTDSTDQFWKVTSAANVVTIFGKSENAREFDPKAPSRVFKWLPEEVYDDKGNHRIYVYSKDSEGGRNQQVKAYLSKIKYGNDKPITEGALTLGTASMKGNSWHFEIVFDYGEYEIKKDKLDNYTPTGKPSVRPDSFSEYNAGFEIRTTRLLCNVLLFHRFDELSKTTPILVDQLSLSFDSSPYQCKLINAMHTGWEFLNETLAKTSKNDSKEYYRNKSMPPVEMGYTPFYPLEEGYQAHAFTSFGKENLWSYEFVDLHSEGIPGLLHADGESVLYHEPMNLDVKGEEVTYSKNESLSFPVGKTANGPLNTLTDVTGNGKLDLVVTNPSQSGYFEMNNNGSWNNFKAFESFPTNFHDPQNAQADLTGDGLSDLVLMEDNKVRYNPSLREKGYAEALLVEKETSVPDAHMPAKATLTTFADFLGAGSAQRVEIRNGSVTCWPGLGYGEFGEAVVLENAPDFGIDFQVNRLHLADIDGTGYTDLAYVYTDRVDIYLNQSGNGFATEPISIPFPKDHQWNPLDKIQFADVLGNGTSCLVFTKMTPKSSQWFYNFNQPETEQLSTQKPHLLCMVKNNLGANTQIHYRSSVWYYLKDKSEGKPWVTHLPFPVNVIDSVTHEDEISGTKLTSSYTYSHGYYDGLEREFRGFGYVGRTDSHSFGAYKPLGETANEAAYHQAPAFTRTWYHTGAYLEESSLLTAYKNEYWKKDKDGKALKDDQAYQMPDTDFSEVNDMDSFTEHGAHRALHGTVLRSEVYGNDDSPWTDIPYSVGESQFKVIEVQKKGDNKYAVFRLYQQQGISYDYERNLADPMVSHQFTLLTDEFGHVLETISVEYARRAAQHYAQQTTDQQLKTWVNYGLSDILNPEEKNNSYLLGIPAQSRAYEIKDQKPKTSLYFDLLDFKDVNPDRPGLKDSLKNDLELLHWERDYYFDASEQKEIIFSEINPVVPVLHHRTEHVVFDKDLLKTQLQQDIPDFVNLLEGDGSDTNGAKGGYITFDSNAEESNYYWNPGASQRYHKWEQFFLPAAFFDPFQYESINEESIVTDFSKVPKTTYSYDKYLLMVSSVEDALGNKSTMSDFDYSEMHAKTMTDPNNNWSKVVTDALGMVIATAHGGTQGNETVGFDVEGYVVFPNPTAGEMISNPQKYLQDAATFFYYDLDSWQNEDQQKRIPAHSVHLNYTEYTSRVKKENQTNIHKSIAYGDGFGRPLQAKAWLNQRQEVRYLNGDQVETKEVNECWLTSGAVVYNDKGKPIQQFEPFYAEDYTYNHSEVLNKVGYASTLFYDALGRGVMTKSADGFFTKTLFGELIEDDSTTEYGGYLNKKLYENLDSQEIGSRESEIGGQGVNNSSFTTQYPLRNTHYATRTTHNSQLATHNSFTPSPWSTLHYDANDCILMNEAQVTDATDVDTNAFDKASKFANTPHQSIVGSDGKVIETRQLNVLETEQDINYTTYDVYGNALTQTDQRLFTARNTDNPALANFTTTYNMGTGVKVVSVDAGTSWSFADIVGHGFYHKDSREFEQFSVFDVLRRPLEVIVTGGTNQAADAEGTITKLNLNNLVKRMAYCDVEGKTVEELTEAQNANLIGNPLFSFDESGLHLAPAYSVMGAALCSRQWVKSDYKDEANWKGLTEMDLEGLSTSILSVHTREALFNLRLPAAIDQLLLTDNFTTFGTHNAIGQTLTATDADGNTQKPLYDSLGREISLGVDAGEKATKANPEGKTPGTLSIRYNAKNQQISEEASNGVVTTHAYDEYNFRLTGIKSTRSSDSKVLQDLIYHHDPVGNVSSVTNNAIPTVFFANQQVEAKATYTYDALYRLITATGREQAGLWTNCQNQQGKKDIPFYQEYVDQKSNVHALKNYTQKFTYDAGGNLLTQQGAGLTRTNSIAKGSNRLVQTTSGSKQQSCLYDAHGNMLTLSGTAGVTWNYRDNMASATQIERPDGTNDTEYYIYDGGGQRVRKISEQLAANGSTNIVEVLYAGGIEIRRSGTLASSSLGDSSPLGGGSNSPLGVGGNSKDGSITYTKTWHAVKLMQGRAVSCLWRYQLTPKEKGGATSQQRFQLTDLLDSSNYEVDHEGKMITYEEFYPYGGTSIITGTNATEVKDKHYRYSSKEQDRTGLYYYGMRYYAPWLGRWTCPDPTGTIDGLNIYAFVEGNPVTSVDIKGDAKYRVYKTNDDKNGITEFIGAYDKKKDTKTFFENENPDGDWKDAYTVETGETQLKRLIKKAGKKKKLEPRYSFDPRYFEFDLKTNTLIKRGGETDGVVKLPVACIDSAEFVVANSANRPLDRYDGDSQYAKNHRVRLNYGNGKWQYINGENSKAHLNSIDNNHLGAELGKVESFDFSEYQPKAGDGLYANLGNGAESQFHAIGIVATVGATGFIALERNAGYTNGDTTFRDGRYLFKYYKSVDDFFDNYNAPENGRALLTLTTLDDMNNDEVEIATKSYESINKFTLKFLKNSGKITKKTKTKTKTKIYKQFKNGLSVITKKNFNNIYRK